MTATTPEAGMCPQAWRTALAAHHTPAPATRPPVDFATPVPAVVPDRLVDDSVADRSTVAGEHPALHLGA